VQNKFKIISEILGDSYRSNDEYLFACPYCKHHKKKLSINIEKNVYKCWICETLGRDLRRLVRRFGDFNHLQAWDKLTNRIDINEFDDLFAEEYKDPEIPKYLGIPQGFSSLTNKPTLSATPALNYLKNRGVVEKDVLYWKMGYCMEGRYAKRIIIPSFDANGDLNYFVARTFSSDPRKYLNPPCSKDVIFNELYLEWDTDLVLTEGVFDAVVAGPNAVPLLGSTLHPNSKLFMKIVQNDTPVFLALDPDAIKKEQRIIKMFLNYGVELYTIDTSGYEDVAEMGREEFIKRKQTAIAVVENDYLLEQAIANI
jgi:DNA primase